LFGANYLNGIVDAQPGANWQGSTRWTMTFKKGGCIGFGTALLRAIHQGLRKIFEDSNPKN
jgi:hypothetical protein